MKSIYIVIALVLIIGIGAFIMKGNTKKDMLINNQDQVAEGTVATSTATGTLIPPVPTPSPTNVVVDNNVPVTNSAVDWEGKYQIVEFGKIVPDSSPMRYDAYAYTDITVKKQNTAYAVSIVLTNDTDKKTLEGRGVVNAAGVLEVYSPEQSLLFTLETYESDRVNADTKFTWVNLKSQLNDGAGDIYFMKRKDL